MLLGLLLIPSASNAVTPPEIDRLQRECTCQTLTCVCPKELMEKVYDFMVNQYADRQVCEAALEKCDVTCRLLVLDEEAKCEQKLATWYRKWYITLPLGVVAGVAAGVVIGIKF